MTSIITHDGTALARHPVTGLVASGPTLGKALAELRRLLARREAA